MFLFTKGFRVLDFVTVDCVTGGSSAEGVRDAVARVSLAGIAGLDRVVRAAAVLLVAIVVVKKESELD